MRFGPLLNNTPAHLPLPFLLLFSSFCSGPAIVRSSHTYMVNFTDQLGLSRMDEDGAWSNRLC